MSAFQLLATTVDAVRTALHVLNERQLHLKELLNYYNQVYVMLYIL